MPIQDEKFVNVYNENFFVVTVRTHTRSFVFKPKTETFTAVYPMTWEEVMFLNSNTNTFTKGLLSFGSRQEEAMEALNNFNWKDIISNEEFESIIRKPTVEGLNRIVAISDPVTFERLRGVFYSLKNMDTDLSSRVEKIIDERFKEIQNGRSTTRIQITPSRVDAMVTHEDVGKIKEQNNTLNAEVADLKLQLEKMMELMRQMSDKDSNKLDEPVEPVDDEAEFEKPKRRSTSKKTAP